MKTPLLVWCNVYAAAGLAAFAAQTSQNSSRHVIGHVPAESDVVLAWNAALSDHFEEFAFARAPYIQARAYAMVHLAMRDAIDTATREARPAPGSFIAQAAANAAAHDILIELCPAGARRFAALRARHVAAPAEDGAVARGCEIGQRIAASLLSHRADDGWPVARSPLPVDNAGIDSLQPTPAKPAPFVLKRVQQFAPQPPYYVYSDGVVAPNRGLRNRKLIGTRADIALDAPTAELWRIETIVRWNRTAGALAAQHPQQLRLRARLFALLNAALADALLSATHWSNAYRHGRTERSLEAIGPIVVSTGTEWNVRSRPSGQWWSTLVMSGFPAVPATLAGAAESILRHHFGDDAPFALSANVSSVGTQTDVTSLRIAARACAWSAHVGGASTPESCVAGYDLGSRIASYLMKQHRR